MPTLIIGAGLAGLRTAAELRAAGYSEKITLIGAETHPPYDRPPLSATLVSAPAPVWLADDLAIDWPHVADEVHLGVRARGLTLGATAVVHTDTAGDLEATDVVVATGARAVNPWPGTHTVTTLDDAERLRSALAGGSHRVTIIGAGWIGVELAHELNAAGHTVTLLEAAAHPLHEHLGEAAAHVARWLAEIDVRTETTVLGVEGTRVHTASGAIDADVVITAVGVHPATAWLDDSGVGRDERGFIPVDSTGRATTPGGPGSARVWAVGDTASKEDPRFGRVDGGHWFAALHDPAQVAAAIVGLPPPAASVPEIFSDQGPHRIVALGALRGDQTVLRGNVETGSWVLFHLDRERLIGAVVANSPRETSSIRRALGRPDFVEITAEELADESVPLRNLLRR